MFFKLHKLVAKPFENKKVNLDDNFNHKVNESLLFQIRNDSNPIIYHRSLFDNAIEKNGASESNFIDKNNMNNDIDYSLNDKIDNKEKDKENVRIILKNWLNIASGNFILT
jgi:hypothetical protein